MPYIYINIKIINLAIFNQLKIGLFITAASAFIFAIFVDTTSKAYAQNSLEKPPMVIEIYTSKFCPACPQGDRMFNGLIEQNPNIIGLSCHVSYFNRGTNADQYAKPFCDARQGIYKMALGTGGIYTPMIIANGAAAAPGTKHKKVQNALKKAESKVLAPIALSLNGQYLDIHLPRTALDNPADIWLFEIEKSSKKSGYTQYRNNITNITKLMRWDGKAANMAFPVNSDPNIKYAVIAQSFKDGIVAGGQTKN